MFHICISSTKDYIGLERVKTILSEVKRDLRPLLKSKDLNLESWVKIKTQELLAKGKLSPGQRLIVRYTFKSKVKQKELTGLSK